MARDDSSPLKLNLPDVFAFAQDRTKPKHARKRRLVVRIDHDEDEGLTRGTIVLVEDDDEVGRLVARMFRHEGYQVLRATCVAEARTLLDENRADFLLARRQAVPINPETEAALQKIPARTAVRIVDNFAELILGQVVEYDSMSQSYLGMLDMLISQLEGTDPKNRGHGQSVAKYCRLVGQRLGLSRRDLDALSIAAYVHDLDSLVTAGRISKVTRTGQEVLLPAFEGTVKSLTQVPFPFEVHSLLQMASRIGARASGNDGQSTPDPSVSAHILRIADVYDTLRRETNCAEEQDRVFDWMRSLSPQTFDPSVLEVFINIRKNERMISSMDIFLATVLIADPNPEDVNQLRLRLENDDFRVFVVASVEEALRVMRSENVTIVITEHIFRDGEDGMKLLEIAKGDPSLRHVPIVFHAASDTTKIKHALELGAEDWLAKPHNLEILVMKLDRLVGRLRGEHSAHVEGVRGSIRDMGTIEMVQILCAAGRSVQILFENGDQRAEMVLHKGKVISATLGDLSGDRAAIEILLWDDGFFRLAPMRGAPPSSVTMNTDNLIMESCFQKDIRQGRANDA